MKQNEFNRAVARAMGESISTVAKHGFVPLMPVPLERETPKPDHESLLDKVIAPTDPRKEGRDAA